MFCSKLIKWTAIGAIGASAAGFFLFGDHAFSYLSTAASSIREGVNDKIPIEFELKRAEALIREIDPQIHEGKRQVAQAEVELENLEREVERLEEAVERGSHKLRAVTAKFGDGVTMAQLASTSKYRVELDLERTFDTYRNNTALLDGKRALIERQAKAVAAARSHLDAVRSEKANLEDMIATLKTQKKQVDALAASSRNFEFDDTALGQAKDVLASVRKRLDVQQRLIEDEIYFEAGAAKTAMGDEPRRDIVAEIREHFEGSDAVTAAAVEVK